MDIELFPSEGNQVFREYTWQGEAFLRPPVISVQIPVPPPSHHGTLNKLPAAGSLPTARWWEDPLPHQGAVRAKIQSAT